MTEKQLRLKAAEGTNFSLDTINETPQAQLLSGGKSPIRLGTVSGPAEHAQESPGRRADGWPRPPAQNGSPSMRGIANITVNRVLPPSRGRASVSGNRAAESPAKAATVAFRGLTMRLSLERGSQSGSPAND